VVTPEALVSCVIPVYNGARFLAEAVDSVLAQTGCRVEVIVVDDGSTDGTASLTRSFGPPVQYVWKENGGPSSALHKGFPLARGEFVASLDADDVWAPGKLERQLAAFAARPELDVCLSHVQNFWEAEIAEEEVRQRSHRRARPVPGYTFGTLLARRTAMERVGPPDPGRLHGYAAEWFLRARDEGLVIEMLPDVHLRRRLHRHNRSRSLAAANRETFLNLIKERMDGARGSPPTDEPEQSDG
jgi:glycosyltransferase involved in cell wall biosynthesis